MFSMHLAVWLMFSDTYSNASIINWLQLKNNNGKMGRKSINKHQDVAYDRRL